MPTSGGLLTIYGISRPSHCYITNIFISGANFGADAAQVHIFIGGDLCKDVVVSVAHTEIQCLAPEGTGSRAMLLQISNKYVHAELSYQGMK